MEWLSVNVTPERFQASTTDEGFYEATRDLMIGTFELLDHTPVTALGVNREFRYQLESEKSWHLLGDTLAPKDGWMDERDKPA
jgi:hypothetical protein